MKEEVDQEDSKAKETEDKKEEVAAIKEGEVAMAAGAEEVLEAELLYLMQLPELKSCFIPITSN